MQTSVTIEPKDSSFAICTDGKVPQTTPGKKPFVVPSKALADAIAAEWSASKKFNPSQMLLTSLAFTAIDRIDGQEESIIEALMTYVDTDIAVLPRQQLGKILEQEKRNGTWFWRSARKIQRHLADHHRHQRARAVWRSCMTASAAICRVWTR